MSAYGRTRRIARIATRALAVAWFALLLFWVCQPYPTTAPRRSDGWIPLEVDGGTGRVKLQSPEFESVPAIGETRWLLDASTDERVSFGEFRVVDARTGDSNAPEDTESSGFATFEPVAALDSERLDALTTTFGELTLCESDPDALPDACARRLNERTARFGPASTALATDLCVGGVAAGRRSGAWTTILVSTGVLLLSLFFARTFCGWLCPTGALVDFADFLCAPIRQFVEKRRRNAATCRKTDPRPDVSYRFRLFLAVGLISATCGGVAFVGWFSPIATLTRNAGASLGPVQTASYRGWGQVPVPTIGAIVSVVVFLVFLALGTLGRRTFCRWICPAGAIFALLNRLRVFGYSVDGERCVSCGRCSKVCSFDAIAAPCAETCVRIDANCASCGNCADVCPRNAISYGLVVRPAGATRSDSCGSVGSNCPTDANRRERRRALARLGGLAATAFGGTALGRISAESALASEPIVRPPGAVSEREFLRRCVRCGECFRACPNDALKPVDFDGGLARLATPTLNADWSGCEPSCANCGRVCPTGAIRTLTIPEKRRFVLGLAVVDRTACLPFTGAADCRLCVDECARAGYDAIEFVAVGTQIDKDGRPIEDVGFLAPVVRAERCVGCGLCQARCAAIVVRTDKALARPAIKVTAIRKND
ncbi:MAG: 4Fe-4S binding protein [Thermoguttaceae bacterium]|nr:4Fe-4S binding protein [Thermoguttaceae bacterium]